MRKRSPLIVFCVALISGSASGSVKLADFEEKSLDLIEKTRPAVESAAFAGLQQMFKEKGVAVRYLTKGAYTAKFTNAKDEKEYYLTAVPMASNFRQAAPPLPALILSDGEEFRAGWLQPGRNQRGELICVLQATDGDLIAYANLIDTPKESPLPVPRGEAAIAIVKNPEKDDVILILCRSPYEAKKEEEKEYSAVIFYSGDMTWDKFAVPQKAEEE